MRYLSAKELSHLQVAGQIPRRRPPRRPQLSLLGIMSALTLVCFGAAASRTVRGSDLITIFVALSIASAYLLTPRRTWLWVTALSAVSVAGLANLGIAGVIDWNPIKSLRLARACSYVEDRTIAVMGLLSIRRRARPDAGVDLAPVYKSETSQAWRPPPLSE